MTGRWKQYGGWRLQAKKSEHYVRFVLFFNFYVFKILFPFDRCRRLTGNIVSDAVDAAHFVNDAV